MVEERRQKMRKKKGELIPKMREIYFGFSKGLEGDGGAVIGYENIEITCRMLIGWHIRIVLVFRRSHVADIVYVW